MEVIKNVVDRTLPTRGIKKDLQHLVREAYYIRESGPLDKEAYQAVFICTHTDVINYYCMNAVPGVLPHPLHIGTNNNLGAPVDFCSAKPYFALHEQHRKDRCTESSCR